MLGKTIVAPASAPGRGGVSVIRMSGAKAKAIAEDMCGGLAQSWKFRKCKIKSTDGLVLDSGLVVFLSRLTLTLVKTLLNFTVTEIRQL